MIDRKKVIRLIEESVDQCYRTIDLPALRDILALLKEQEAVKPKKRIIQKKASIAVEFAVIHYGWMSCIALTAADV